MAKDARRSITLRLTDEQQGWLDEVRTYMHREAHTTFGPPEVSDREAALLLMHAGYQAKKKVLRAPADGGRPPHADPPHGRSAGDPGAPLGGIPRP